MKKSNPESAVFNINATRLLSLMSLDETSPDQWRPEDIAAIVRHQFSAPLEFDLSDTQESKSSALRQSLTEAGAKRIRCFEDLLFHSEPPLPLLKLSKEFFKTRTQQQK